MSAVRVRLSADGLSKANTSNGDINGYRVEYAIDISTDQGSFVEVLKTAFDGKTTSKYERTHRIELPKASSGWSVRVRRLTANANSQTTSDRTSVISYTEVIDAKLRYPMSAIVGVQVDASQFQSIPVRAYDMYLKIVKVPSNYDPEKRTYDGDWDGTFKPAWSNNPAWVFYDLVLNDRYGLAISSRIYRSTNGRFTGLPDTPTRWCRTARAAMNPVLPATSTSSPVKKPTPSCRTSPLFSGV